MKEHNVKIFYPSQFLLQTFFYLCWWNNNTGILFLQAPNGVPPAHVYEQLLTIYLLQNDL